jgi:hypothetical protein
MTYAINCYRELKELPTETSDMSLLTDLLDNYRQVRHNLITRSLISTLRC